MDKHAKKLIILERIVKEQKAGAKIGMVIGIPMVLIFGISAMVSFASGAAFIVGLPIIGAIIALLVLNYYSIEKGITKMRSELGVATDEEFEDILESCNRITNTVFIDNRYIINFDSNIVTRLGDIKSCKVYKSSDDTSTTYGITINVRKGKNDNLKFSRESARDEAYKIITTAVGFAEGQKYINWGTGIDDDSDRPYTIKMKVRAEGMK